MIKAVAVYTADYIKAVNKYEKILIRLLVRSIIYAPLFIFLIKNIPKIKPYEEYRYIVFASELACMLFIFDILYIIIDYIIKFYKNKKQFFNTLIRYEFDEEDFSCEMQNEKFNMQRHYKYDELFSVIETEKYFLIYPERNMVFITGKNDITEGSSEQLKQIFSKKISKKYKRKSLI